MKKPVGVLLVVIVIAGAVGAGLVRHQSEKKKVPEGYTKVEGYNPAGVCAALIPECGYCAGKVIEAACYMPIMR